MPCLITSHHLLCAQNLFQWLLICYQNFYSFSLKEFPMFSCTLVSSVMEEHQKFSEPFFLVCIASKVVFKTEIFSANSWSRKWFQEAQGRKQNRDRKNANTLSVISRLCFRQLELNSTEIFQETMWSISQNHLSREREAVLYPMDSHLPMVEGYSGGINTPIPGFHSSGENPHLENKRDSCS